MLSSVDQLEQQVSRAVDYIGALRAEVGRLLLVLEERTAPLPEGVRDQPPLPDDCGPLATRLAVDNERLRAERVLVLERVRGLIKEIEKAVW